MPGHPEVETAEVPAVGELVVSPHLQAQGDEPQGVKRQGRDADVEQEAFYNLPQRARLARGGYAMRFCQRFPLLCRFAAEERTIPVSSDELKARPFGVSAASIHRAA